MKQGVIIRKATPKDLKEILRLNTLLFKKEYREYDKTLNINYPRTQKAKKYFLSRITKKSGFVRVAEVKGRIVGYICAGIIAPRSYYKQQYIFAELENTFIEIPHRSKGIGATFMKEFLAWCTTQRVKFVLVEASAENQRAIAFYRSHHFSNLNLMLVNKLY